MGTFRSGEKTGFNNICQKQNGLVCSFEK